MKMSLIVPYYITGNPYFPVRMNQHFMLEISPEDVMFILDNISQVRCPAGYLRRWQSLANQNDFGSNLMYDSNTFEVQLDVRQFEPNEINVKLENGIVVVEGSHAEKADGQGFISRQFVRKYDIPENSDTNHIQSTLSSDGILKITIPARVQFERVIPVQFGVPHADAA